MRNHELVDNEDARPRFTEFGSSSLDIEVWSYITVSDYAKSRLIRQELLLEILDRLANADIVIAFPTRTVHLVRGRTERTIAVVTRALWRKALRNTAPAFADLRIKADRLLAALLC